MLSLVHPGLCHPMYVRHARCYCLLVAAAVMMVVGFAESACLGTAHRGGGAGPLSITVGGGGGGAVGPISINCCRAARPAPIHIPRRCVAALGPCRTAPPAAVSQ